MTVILPGRKLKRITLDHLSNTQTKKANKSYTMSYHDKLIKSEWAWIHSYTSYDNSKDSNLSKTRREHYSQGVARSTRSMTRQRKSGNDEIYNRYLAENKAHNMVCWRTNNLLPSFLNFRKVCAELKRTT